MLRMKQVGQELFQIQPIKNLPRYLQILKSIKNEIQIVHLIMY